MQQKTAVASQGSGQDSAVTVPSGDEAVLYGLIGRILTTLPTLLEKARATYQAGYRKISAYSPFPIDELPAAIGLRPSRLPLLALAGGVVGLWPVSAAVWNSRHRQPVEHRWPAPQ